MQTDLGSAAFWARIKDDPEKLAAEVCFVDVVNLDQTLQHHSSLRAWVNAAFEVASIDVEQAQWDLTRARATALHAAKADRTDGKKEKTVQAIEAEVDLNPRVEEAMRTLLLVQRKRGALRAMAKALEDRKDMLIQIAAKQRQEQRESQG